VTIEVQHAIGGLLARYGRGGGAGGGGSGGGSTPTPQTATIFGFNTNESDGFDQTVAGRQAWFSGRAPCVRRYSGARWNLNNGVFPFTTSTAPEKRISYSTKADSSGTYSKSGIAAGNGNSMLRDWLESIPAGWAVWLTYYHEPNDDFRDGSLSVTHFRDAHEQFRTTIDSAALQTGVTVKLTPNFMAYNVHDTPTFFSDSWVPPVGVADLLTFDLYGNPGEFTSQTTANTYGAPTGAAYGTTYPLVANRMADTFAAIERNGFADHWGLLEFNTPARDWDTTESNRAQWFTDALAHIMAPPMTGAVPPEIVLLWEAPSGVNWDQRFGRVSGNALTCANIWKPYMTSTPVGG
jgi:hypothetical protein